MKALRDFALAVMATLMVLLGLWIGLFAAGWLAWLPYLLPLLSAISLSILVTLLWAQRRWVRIEDPMPYVQQEPVGVDSSPHPAPADDEMIVELAALRYELSDMAEPTQFANFLDRPLLVKPNAPPNTAYATPAQVVEETILAYVKAMEAACGGRVTSSVSITRGSLTISLAFLSVYGFLAQYHDFVESLSLLRLQIQGLMQQVNHWYYGESGREVQVRSHVQLTSPAAARQQAAKAALAGATNGIPFGVSTTVTPAHNDIRIHVATGSLVNGLLTLLLGVLIVFQLLVLIAYLTCLGRNGAAICVDLAAQFAPWFDHFVDQLHARF